MTNMKLQWEVTKYGQLIERSDIESDDIGVITTKYTNIEVNIMWNFGKMDVTLILVR